MSPAFSAKLTLSDADFAILDRDYDPGEVLREAANAFPLVKRGSVRLVRDLYRTEAEFREYIAEGLALRLPGQNPSR